MQSFADAVLVRVPGLASWYFSPQSKDSQGRRERGLRGLLVIAIPVSETGGQHEDVAAGLDAAADAGL